MNTAPPPRIGRYRVLGSLGRGPLGEVLAAHDERLDRPVAIKLLHADQDGRFETEARLNARLSHPNVVQVYDFVTSDGHDHIVTEYVEGSSLRELFGAEKPSVGRSLEHLCAIASGLAAAHQQGVVHRGLRLENILVTRDGQTKIADFGTAALREGTRKDERADLHDLGVIARELLSGAPDIPSELKALVEHLLEHDSQPKSAREVETELRAIASRVMDAAAPPKANVQLRQVAVVALHMPQPRTSIEEIGARVADWRRSVNELAAHYQAHVMWQATLDPIISVGYPRVHGDNAAAAANLFTTLAGAGISGGIDLGKVAVVEQPDGPIIVGPAVDGAVATCRRAPVGSAYVTHAVQRGLSRSFRLSPVGGETSAGRAAVVYRLEEPLDWEARGAMGATPLVGRREVLARIAETEHEAFTNGGRGLVIVGPPGSGKSRVVRAAAEATKAARIVYLRGTEQTRSNAFASVERLIRGLPELRDESGPSRERVVGCLSALPSSSSEMVAAIARLAGVENADDEKLLARAASYAGAGFIVDHVARFLVDLLAPYPSLLAVEDVFWLDTSSLDVVRSIGRLASTQPLFVLCTSRPSPLLRHVPEAQFPRHELAPLSADEAMQLVDATTIGRVLSPRTAHAIVERGGGLPLVIEELTQFVSARRDAPEVQNIPTSFADAILERFQDLGAETQRIARIAATIGNQVDEQLLLAVVATPRNQLRSHIELLAREGLFHPTTLGERTVHAFRHALTRDAIYEGQPPAARAALHRDILAKIDELFPEWETEHPEVVALQCDGAGEVRRGIGAWLAAGRRALSARSAAVATQHFEAALQMLERASGESWARETELEVRRAYAPALSGLTNWASKEVNANHARIRELADASSQAADWSATFLSLSEDLMAGNADSLSAKLGWLDAQFDETSPLAPVNRYLLDSMNGMLSVFAGYLVRARELCDRALAVRDALIPILQAFPVAEPMTVPRTYLAFIEMLEGRRDAAWKYQTDEENAHERDSLGHVTACCYGIPLAMLGHDWARARERIDLVESVPLAPHHKALVDYQRAVLQLRDAGDNVAATLTDVARHIDAATNAFDRWRGDPPIIRAGVPVFLSSLAQACLDVARAHRSSDAGARALERGRELADALLRLAAEANVLDRYIVSEVYRLDAEILELEGKSEEATRARKEALARAEAIDVSQGSTPLLVQRIPPPSPR